jgi:hypothetical protein
MLTVPVELHNQNAYHNSRQRKTSTTLSNMYESTIERTHKHQDCKGRNWVKVYDFGILSVDQY